MSALQKAEIIDACTDLVPQANPYLNMIETMVARGGDLSNLDKMLDLQIKWEANEARKAYVAAMAAFKAEPMEILKRKLVSFTTRDGDTTSYTHAELADVTDVVVPTMGKHGLSHRWDVKQEGGQITVACTITHALGHSESVSLSAGGDSSGKKNAIQQVASTITYLERYTLLAATGMATKGMDDDGRGYDYRDEPAEPDYSEWFQKIAGAPDLAALRKVKDEMLAKIGDEKNRVPKPVLAAYNDRVKEVTEHME
ncbi:ERF family protein [Novilysobacter erysipheiresistens]|uniref:ERF family protein n=1 Tax=Novilysobacter erysipheiresistens TaxID=1749332 RepID=A0ABU7YUJ9_9GAMM